MSRFPLSSRWKSGDTEGSFERSACQIVYRVSLFHSEAKTTAWDTFSCRITAWARQLRSSSSRNHNTKETKHVIWSRRTVWSRCVGLRVSVRPRDRRAVDVHVPVFRSCAVHLSQVLSLLIQTTMRSTRASWSSRGHSNPTASGGRRRTPAGQVGESAKCRQNHE